MKLVQMNKNFAYSIFLLLFLCSFLPGSIQLLAQRNVEDITRPEELYQYAKGLMQREFWDLAYVQLKNFKQRFPEHKDEKEIQHLLIHCLLKLEKDQETLDEIIFFRGKWPRDPLNEQFSVAAAKIYYTQNNYQEAVQLYESLIKSSDEELSEEGLYRSALCYLELQKKDAALDKLRVLSSRPFKKDRQSRVHATYFLAAEAMHSNEMAFAKQLFTKIADSTFADADLRKTALINILKIEYSAQNFKEALVACEKFIMQFPDDEMLQDVRQQRLLTVYNLKEYALFIDLMKDWHKTYPESYILEMDLKLAESFLELQRYEEALEVFKRVLEQPQLPVESRYSCLFQEFLCLNYLERLEELLQKTRQILEEFPNSPQKGLLLYESGIAAQKLHKHAEATPLLRAAMQYFVGEKENYIESGKGLLNSLQAIEKWAEAAFVSREIAAVLPKDEQPFFLLLAVRFDYQLEKWSDVKAGSEKILQDWQELEEIKKEALQLNYSANLALEEYQAAAKNLEILKLLTDKKERAEISLRLANIYLYLNELQKADLLLEEELQTAQFSEESSFDMLVLHYRIQMELEKELEAMRSAEMILQADNTKQAKLSADFWLSIGELFYNKKRSSEAEKALLVALKLEENDEKKIRIVKLLGELMLLQNRFVEMEQLFSKKITEVANKNSDADFFSMQAELFFQLNKYELAFAAINRCFSDEASGSIRAVTRARWVMAKMLFEQEKDAENALSYCTKAFVLADDEIYSARALQLAVEIYLAINKEDEAKASWNELKNRYPQAAAKVKIKQMINRE